MTLAAELAHTVCPSYVPPEDGMVHDPAFPLVLGDQLNGNYAILSYNQTNHTFELRVVYAPAGGGPIQQAYLTLTVDGTLLLNGASIANLPELQALVTQAQAYANQSALSANASAASATASDNSSSVATTAAAEAQEDADLSKAYAIGTVDADPPPVGNSSAVSAALAQSIAVESRDLDLSADVTTGYTFASGDLFVNHPCKPTGAIDITIPAGIFSSPDKKARWSTYQLLSTGSVRFVAAAGGTNLVTPTIVGSGRYQMRWGAADNATRRTITVPVSLPAVTNGELCFIFHALHQSATQNPISMNFSTSGGPGGLTWDVIEALPSLPAAGQYPTYYAARAKLVGTAAGSINLIFDEGVYPHFQCCDWWVLEGTEGSLPLFARDARAGNTPRNNASATLNSLTNAALVLASGAVAAPIGSAAFSNFSGNLVKDISGNTAGIDETLASDSNGSKNEAYGVGHGVATAAGNFTGVINWSSAAYRTNIALLGYKAKTVVGGGDVVLRFQGTPPRDTLTEMNGVAELWFQNDGKTVDVRIAKP